MPDEIEESPNTTEEEIEQEQVQEVAEEAIVIAYATAEVVSALQTQVDTLAIEVARLGSLENHEHQHEHSVEGNAVVPPDEVIIEPTVPHIWQRFPKWF